MYSRIILFLLVIILFAFLYLNSVNPEEGNFMVTKDWTFAMPVTVLVFLGFFSGMVLAVLNSLFVDARRAIKDIRARREKKLVNQSEANYRRGTEELLRGNPHKARQLLTKALEANQQDIDILLSLAKANMEDKRPQEAVKVLEAGLLKDPGNMEVLSAVAKNSLSIGDTYKAVKTFKEMLDRDPTSPFALKGLRDLRVEQDEWEEAAQLQRRHVSRGRNGEDLAKDKELLAALLYESAVTCMKDGNLDEAAEKAKEALENDDAFIPAHILIGDVQYSKGNSADAIKVWEKAYDRYHDVAFFLRLEDMYLRESDPQKILDRYEKAIKARPGEVNLRLLLSRLYLRLEMVDDAIEELERIGSEGEEGFYQRILLGEAYSRREQGSKAANLLKSALGLDKELPSPFRCSWCNHSAVQWRSRCPGCKRWNTFRMSTDFSPALTSPAIPQSERTEQ
jgi:lipopolysaccharide biosynthesis regulator YciM